MATHAQERPWQAPARWVVLLLCAVALVLVAPDVVKALGDLSRWLADNAGRAGPWAPVAFVLVAALSALVSPFSSVPLAPAAVLRWGDWTTFVLLLSGWMAGGALAWVIGRWAGHPLVARWLPQKRLERLSERVPPKRALLVAALMRIALPSEVGYAYGALRFGFWRYLAITLLAEAPVAALVTWGGSAIVEGRLFALGALLLAGIALGLLAWWLRQKPGERPRSA